jgi:exosortase J
MSAYPDSEIVVQMVRTKGLAPVQFAALGAVFAALGVATVWPTAQALWKMWMAEPTKSIGMAIPVVSLVLVLRAWRALGWRAEGSWWGLAVLLATAAAVWTQQRAVLVLVVTPHWSTVLPPASLVAVGYAAGAVLLLGGTRLFRAALFPILLLWFVNPVPHAFSLLVDLPLQTVSAHMARAFAMALGQHLTPDKLRLMFTPDFGMFIAPGCNGIRGSVTMGFIALIAGYVYRFRWYATALVVMGAVLLGYVFNLARLCLLVLYYVVALHLPWLQDKAEGADYLIGAALFLVATLLLFSVIHRLRDAGSLNAPEAAAPPEPGGVQPRTSGVHYAQLAAMGAIALVGCAGVARAGVATRPSAIKADAATGRFPARIGSYTLVRSWNETLLSGAVIYIWGEYAPAGGGTPIAVGVSPVLLHDPLLCHTVRGDSPLWQGPLTFADAGAVPTNFNSALYSDGVTEYLEASTQCSGTSCGEFATERTHFGFIYSQPDPETLLSGDPKPPIPVLVRAETTDVALPADAARQQLTGDLRAFLGSVRLEDLTRPYSR